MRYAVISNNVVVNCIIADDPTQFPSMNLVQTDVAGIGWLYDAQTGEFARPAGDPEPPSPRTIPKIQWKMRISPQKYGVLRDLSSTDPIVWAFMDLLNDPTLTEIELDSPYLSGALDYLMTTYPDLVTAADKAQWMA